MTTDSGRSSLPGNGSWASIAWTLSALGVLEPRVNRTSWPARTNAFATWLSRANGAPVSGGIFNRPVGERCVALEKSVQGVPNGSKPMKAGLRTSPRAHLCKTTFSSFGKAAALVSKKNLCSSAVEAVTISFSSFV